MSSDDAHAVLEKVDVAAKRGIVHSGNMLKHFKDHHLSRFDIEAEVDQGLKNRTVWTWKYRGRTYYGWQRGETWIGGIINHKGKFEVKHHGPFGKNAQEDLRKWDDPLNPILPPKGPRDPDPDPDADPDYEALLRDIPTRMTPISFPASTPGSGSSGSSGTSAATTVAVTAAAGAGGFAGGFAAGFVATEAITAPTKALYVTPALPVALLADVGAVGVGLVTGLFGAVFGGAAGYEASSW